MDDEIEVLEQLSAHLSGDPLLEAHDHLAMERAYEPGRHFAERGGRSFDSRGGSGARLSHGPHGTTQFEERALRLEQRGLVTQSAGCRRLGRVGGLHWYFHQLDLVL